MSVRARTSLAAAVLAAMQAGCNDNSSSWTPLVTRVLPSIVTADTTAISVQGARFAPGATAYWNGIAQNTAFVSENVLQVQLDPAVTLLSAVGTVTVTNEGSYPSHGFTVAVIGAQLQITSLSPTAVPVGSPDFTLTVMGTGFVSRSQVVWNVSPLQIQFSSSKLLTALVPASLAAVAGTSVVTVTNPVRCENSPPPCSATSNPIQFSVGGPPGLGMKVIGQAANDLAWDGVHGLLFLSVPANAASQPNSISALDPVQGSIVGSVPATDPHVLATSSDGAHLYAGIGPRPGSGGVAPSAIVRYDLPALTGAISWSFAAAAGGILDLQVAPRAPHTVAVSFGTDGLVILDDGVARKNSVATYFGSFDYLQWGLDATRLFAADGSDTAHYFYLLSVDSSGVVLSKSLASAMFDFGSRIHFDSATRRTYGDLGENFDEQGGGSFTFASSPFSGCVMAPDGTVGKAFFACTDGAQLNLHSYDLTTHGPIFTMLVSSWQPNFADHQEFPRRLVRWGANGLALATIPGGSGSPNVYLYSGAFVR